MSARIIEANRSVVFAADVEPEEFTDQVNALEGVEGIGGVKIGFEVGLGLSLEAAVDAVRDTNSNLKVIYDHQKAGNDIPETSRHFARAMQLGEVDAAIIFPYTGPKVQEWWTKALQDRGIPVITGGEMTHEKIRASDGGYISDTAFRRMYLYAVKLGVTDFVVPGNKPDRVIEYKSLFDKELGEGNYTLWAPGFIDQGGDLSETGKLAGPNFHAIVGGGIYKAESPRQAAFALGQKMLALNHRVV